MSLKKTIIPSKTQRLDVFSALFPKTFCIALRHVLISSSVTLVSVAGSFSSQSLRKTVLHPDRLTGIMHAQLLNNSNSVFVGPAWHSTYIGCVCHELHFTAVYKKQDHHDMVQPFGTGMFGSVWCFRHDCGCSRPTVTGHDRLHHGCQEYHCMRVTSWPSCICRDANPNESTAVVYTSSGNVFRSHHPEFHTTALRM